MILEITEHAAKIFHESVQGLEPKPYLRVGAKKGGCSGWTFTIETEEHAQISDSLFEGHGVQMLIDTEQHKNLIGSLRVEYNDANLVEQGFVFKRLGTGQLCGCGESFTPLGSNEKLGWK